jgi:hypothetical protein
MREEKRSEIIHDAIGFLDDELIEDVDALRSGMTPSMKEKTPRPMFLKRKWVAIAASICLFFVIGHMWDGTSNSNVMMDAETSDGKDQQENMQLGENFGNKFEDEELEDSVIESCPVSPEEDVEQEICTEDTETEDSEMDE